MSKLDGMKERLTVFVGAGASCALGVPGTLEVTKRILGSDEAYHRGATPIFNWVQNQIAERYEHNVNFEHILHALECLENYYQSEIKPNTFKPNAGAIEWTLAKSLYDVLENPHSSLNSRIGSKLRGISIAIDTLYKDLRKIFGSSHKKALEVPQWPSFVKFWKRLYSEYDLDIITTNYDRCIEEGLLAAGCPDAEHGFVKDSIYPQYGVFDARLLRRHTGSRILHLHGSTQYSDRGERADKRGLYGQPRLPADQVMWWDGAALESELLLPGSSERTQSGSVRVGPMITGLRKPDKLLAAEPYATYYNLFQQIMMENSKLLIIGYGFGDFHINSLFMRMHHWHARTRRVACISYVEKKDSEWQELPDWCSKEEAGMAVFKWLSGVYDEGTIAFAKNADSRLRVWHDRFMLRSTGFLSRDDDTQSDEVLGFLRQVPLSTDYVICQPHTMMG